MSIQRFGFTRLLGILALAAFALSMAPARAGDSDLDGFSDEFEAGAGTNPNDPQSTPLGTTAVGPAQPLSVDTLAIQLAYSQSTSDALGLRVPIALPAGFIAAGQPVAVNVGGNVRTFVLNTGGGANGSDYSAILDTNSLFISMVMDLQAALADENLVNVNTASTGEQRTIHVEVAINGNLYATDVTGLWIVENNGGTFAYPAKPQQPGKEGELVNFTIFPNPVDVGQPVTFTATFNVPLSDVTGTIDYGDGIVEDVSVSGTQVSSSTGAITHTYTADGVYLMTIQGQAGDGTYSVSQFVVVGDNSVVNPIDEMISTAQLLNGDLTLNLNISLVDGATDAETDFEDELGREAPIAGLIPTRHYTTFGLSVATSKALDSARNIKGKVRKTVAVSKRSIGDSDALNDPPSNAIKVKKVSGKFLFDKSKPDKVDFQGEFQLPAGFDPKRPDGNALDVGIGNIIDSIVVNDKGKGILPSSKGRILKAQIKYPKLAGVAQGGETAKLSVTISLVGMVDSGFDTEGITPTLRPGEEKLKTASRMVQTQVMLAGVAYDVLAPVAFKISKNGAAGQIQGRSGIGGK